MQALDPTRAALAVGATYSCHARFLRVCCSRRMRVPARSNLRGDSKLGRRFNLVSAPRGVYNPRRAIEKGFSSPRARMQDHCLAV